jgi:hypothetical protein
MQSVERLQNIAVECVCGRSSMYKGRKNVSDASEKKVAQDQNKSQQAHMVHGPESPTTVVEDTAIQKTALSQTKKLVFIDSELPARTRFTKTMILRAQEDGILPHEILFAIAVDDSIEFTDYWIDKVHGPQAYQRKATPKEKIECARDAAPYYYAKKPISVAHEGQIEILHALAQSPLDAVELDNGENIVESDFEEVS